MNLHHDKEAFEELIIGAANELAIPTNVIEKDYYVTITLKALSEKLEDLSYMAESGVPGESRKKRLKKAVVSTMDEF